MGDPIGRGAELERGDSGDSDLQARAPPHTGLDAKEAMRFLAEVGEKAMKQRSAVIDAFFVSSAEVTTRKLWERLRTRGHPVSITAVQHTLNKLVQHGLATHRRFGRRKEALFRPALRRVEDGRITCSKCCLVSSFSDDRLEELMEKAAKRLGFVLRAHRLEAYGVCERCRGRDAPG